ncbi:MAG TPA: amidohydrolase family protein [Candidatus Kryptonia bacterium]|nr:amidohydrolase family protein [Candidatus Kryptonia bacterium]
MRYGIGAEVWVARIAWVAAVVLAGCGGHAFVTRAPDARPSCVIRNVRVFDAARAVLLDGLRDVVVRDGRIAAIASPGATAAGLAETDGHGATLLPGFVDVHTHTGGSASPPWRTELPAQEENLGAFLYAGVTTVLDAGALTPAIFQLRDKVRSGAVLSPHLYAAGPMFTAPNGHPVGLMRGNLPFWIGWYILPRIAREVATPDAARQAVADLLPHRPDVIKVAVDDLVPGEPRIATEVIAAIVARAHESHVRVVAHIGQSRDVIDSVGAGVDALMHDVYNGPITDEAIAKLAAARIPVVATVGIWDAVEQLGTLRADTVSSLTREIAKPAVLDALSAFPNDSVRSQMSAMRQPVMDGHAARRTNVAKLRAAGVPILVGSDAVNAGQFPGAGLHNELVKLVESGMPANEVLRAATYDNARFLGGEQADFGEVAPGKRADLVLVQGDPTADITATQRIAHVWLEGVELERHPR